MFLLTMLILIFILVGIGQRGLAGTVVGREEGVGGGVLASLVGFIPLSAVAVKTVGTDAVAVAVASDVAADLVHLADINTRLVQPKNDSAGKNANGEWDRRYLLVDVTQSDMIADMRHPAVTKQADTALLEKHLAAKRTCDRPGALDVLDSGAWCLSPRTGGDTIGSINTGGNKDHTFVIPINHMVASTRLVSELLTLIKDENVASIIDFGAGVGQYKEAILQQENGQHVLPNQKRPDVKWNSYDGAGNVVEYTKGYVTYVDLTLPLELPKADWVVALEVGEHVPNQYEGMLIRNLHHHNCKGIILSWAVVGQDGHSHVNNHSNDYIISIFKELGYVEDLDLKARLRNPVDNYGWFVASTMAFRRLVASPNQGCSNP